ncbi:MAG: hypothetical protein CO150_03055 [Nitrospirae bacterium CG_4_9_14_3_um_filter_53_35]|nr:MAG: hypothetical protein AUK29_00655 [Nitrospirae bacterium CG2_30_53_67]PIS36256.1 MAG: hypothetical protein COT35_12125 [Nitrospirae bacterium CG08_land_8_20_14_0_20_52_24]PIV85364.1 MAG: hypothetical protein COW52_02680 [Nitrospirae bacterium CG17_big_fil_post_rev_8_21_14_2_50_50_9]PIW85378.1 MAG: hypothetical protein COZ95_04865 [Nitrospirae bacterium CG_4_8_14_3_um_filter_50_41]PJA76527.1 MAG: hypothetical protein CO150_03055 [Nitrospirae bacterium CG_4_9_14_3_um_filter_53_35]
MPHKRTLIPIIVLLSALMAGCAGITGRAGNSVLNGYVYTHIRIPYTINLDNTPASAHQAAGKILQINEPFSGYGLYAKLKSNAFGDIAKKHGLKKVYFADVEIKNILGIWRDETIHIYGE